MREEEGEGEEERGRQMWRDILLVLRVSDFQMLCLIIKVIQRRNTYMITNAKISLPSQKIANSI